MFKLQPAKVCPKETDVSFSNGVLKPVLAASMTLLAACNDSGSGDVTPQANKKPVASLSVTPAIDGLSVVIYDKMTDTGKGIYDPDGYILKAVLDYGDGQKYTSVGTPVSSLALSHSYKADGTYTLTLTVWDNHGASDTLSRTLTLKETVVDNVATGLLNDTGIDACANSTTMLSDCHEGMSGLWAGFVQDAQTGRDQLRRRDELAKVGAGESGFDYIKVGGNGKRLPDSVTSWPCVLDVHTGLMWEMKTADGGLHDWRHRYTWYLPDMSVNGGTVGYQDIHELNEEVAAGSRCGHALALCNTHAYVAKVNETGLCGHKDWRLPDYHELTSLLNYGRRQPSIDSTYFRNTASLNYWSASPYAPDGKYVKAVSFADGTDESCLKEAEYPVRLVRARQE